jgi:hypothetical protein
MSVDSEVNPDRANANETFDIAESPDYRITVIKETAACSRHSKGFVSGEQYLATDENFSHKGLVQS